MMLRCFLLGAWLLVGTNADCNRPAGCSEGEDVVSWLQRGRKQNGALEANATTCACEYTLVGGDTCYTLTQDFGVEYSQITDERTGETCPDATLWAEDKMCITDPATTTKCEGPTPTPTPGPSSTCKYTLVSGDTCYALTQDFGVDYSAITDDRTGETCPDATLFVGDEMTIANPTITDKCAGATTTPSPTPPPTPGSCSWPEGFQTVLYWMPYTENDSPPSADILNRVTEVIMAFVGTYAYTKETSYQKYECSTTCQFAPTWPITTKGSEWAQQMKSVNPNLKVTVSFGGWNQGPGDQDLNCYSISGCYSDVSGLADELAKFTDMDYIDGIDLDYEQSTDLVASGSAAPVGVTFLGQLSDALQQKGIHVSQAPQPPYFGSSGSGPGAGSYNDLIKLYPGTNQDVMAIQYYNNDGFAIGTDDAAISDNYWGAVNTMGGDASKVLLGMCFVDCNDGYSAFYPDSTSKSSALAPNLLKTTMAAGDGFGGIMIWANPKSIKNPSCTDGCFAEMPGWLDTVCQSVQ